jgi:anti-sigma factor RsiW
VNCQDTQKLIHGYVDGELDLLTNLEIEQHLQECSACAQAHTSLQEVRAAVKGGSTYFEPPPSLRERIQASVRKAGKAGPAPRPFPRLWLAVAASLAFGVIAGWGLVSALSFRSADAFLTQELLASHVRSHLLPSHRVDIESSDQHTVKPWLVERLDFAPPVPSLEGQGFPLVGGRLDYLDNRPVAALVYQRRKHFINLFIWPSTPDSEVTTKAMTRQGYNLFHWTQSGMTYWAVSDLNENDLQSFMHLIQDQAR